MTRIPQLAFEARYSEFQASSLWLAARDLNQSADCNNEIFALDGDLCPSYSVLALLQCRRRVEVPRTIPPLDGFSGVFGPGCPGE